MSPKEIQLDEFFNDFQDFRVVIKAFHVWMKVNFTKTLCKINLFSWCDLLIAEEDNAMIEQEIKAKLAEHARYLI